MAKYQNVEGKTFHTDLTRFKWELLPKDKYEEYEVLEYEQMDYEEIIEDGRAVIECSNLEEAVKNDELDPYYPDTGATYIWIFFNYTDDDVLHLHPIADHIEYPEADAGYCHRTGILYLNKKEKAFFSKILDDAIGDHHDPEMQKIMTDYHLAIDRDIKLMVNDVMNNRDTLPITVGFVDTRMARDIEKMTGLKTTGNRIILRASDIRHILKRHGENGTADHSMKDIDDIARMSYVLENYDEIRNENRSARQYRTKTGKAAPQLLVSKKVDGRYYVVEVIMDGENRKNAVSTAYLQNRNE